MSEIVRIYQARHMNISWYTEIKSVRGLHFDATLNKANKYNLVDTPFNRKQFEKFREEFDSYRKGRGYDGPSDFDKWIRGYRCSAKFWKELPTTNQQAAKLLSSTYD